MSALFESHACMKDRTCIRATRSLRREATALQPDFRRVRPDRPPAGPSARRERPGRRGSAPSTVPSVRPLWLVAAAAVPFAPYQAVDLISRRLRRQAAGEAERL